MNNIPRNKKLGFVKNSTLILIAFGTAFFPRIISAVGFPSAVNFVHLLIVPLVCTIVFATTKVKNRTQILISQSLLLSLFALLGVMTASAFYNSAGVINVFIAFILLSEPFVFLAAIVCLPLSQKRLRKLKVLVLCFAFVHVILAYIQKILLSLHILSRSDMTVADNVQGVFYLSGGGHVVGASVSMSFALYYLICSKNVSLWIRISAFMGSFIHLLLADAKQVVVVWLIAWLILILAKLDDIVVLIKYLILIILVSTVLFWCIQNLEAFRAFKTWIRPGLYGIDGLATQQKISSIKIISSYHDLPLNWLFGIGPGHTVTRLGAWMLEKYKDLLIPLGATVHPVSQKVMTIAKDSWLDSSFFSPLFGWAGIWGDIGIAGLCTYIYVCSIVWCRLCLDDFSKFMVITVMIHGFIFTQMEEPGYMLSIAFLIGLKWQEYQVQVKNKFLHID